MKKPFNLNTNLFKLLKKESSLPQAEIRTAKYLLTPAMPNKSQVTFLTRLSLDVGNACVRTKSGSFSVSVCL